MRLELLSLRVQDPNSKVLGPKYYTTCGIWALKPHYLGPRTLRAWECLVFRAPRGLMTAATLNPP